MAHANDGAGQTLMINVDVANYAMIFQATSSLICHSKKSVVVQANIVM